LYNSFHSTLTINEDKCIGCSHCMKVCPTEALRVTNGKAHLHADWCIDCGECYRVCPTHAITVVDDDFTKIFDYKRRVLLVSVIFYAQFEGVIPKDVVDQILLNMGFTEVCPVEQSVDSLISEINSYIRQAKVRPVISSFCPAVIRLIQVRFPSLLNNVMLLYPPLESTAEYYQNRAKKEGQKSSDMGIFYVTPCIAKIAAVKSPIGGYKSPVDGVINMDYLYNKVYLAFKQNKFEKNKKIETLPLSSRGVLWPTTGGESSAIEGTSLAIDGIANVISFLERLENNEIDDVDFLELRICDESCAGGILAQCNRFIGANRLRESSKKYPETHNLVGEYRRYCSSYIHMDSIEPRSMVKFDTDLIKAIEKMDKANKIASLLPGIDCGACGAPSCEALSADIVRGEASLNNCIFMRSIAEKEGDISLEEGINMMEKVWGDKRFISNNKLNKKEEINKKKEFKKKENLKEKRKLNKKNPR